MINLLPYEDKREIRAARVNVLLVRYMVILLAAALILGGLVVGSYFVLNTTKQNAESKEAENAQRVAQYQDIKIRSETFRSDLSTAKTVLDGSTSFSRLIYKIADAVPPGVVLDEVTLDPATFGTSMTMNASAKNIDSATKLKDTFIQNSQIFSNVQLLSIRTAETGTSESAYPVKVVLSVVINKGAAQ